MVICCNCSEPCGIPVAKHFENVGAQIPQKSVPSGRRLTDENASLDSRLRINAQVFSVPGQSTEDHQGRTVFIFMLIFESITQPTCVSSPLDGWSAVSIRRPKLLGVEQI